MRKMLLLAVVLVSAALIFDSCSRGITVSEAANGRARCGKHLR